MCEILSPHVEEIVVAGLYEKSRGPKDDLREKVVQELAPYRE